MIVKQGEKFWSASCEVNITMMVETTITRESSAIESKGSLVF